MTKALVCADCLDIRGLDPGGEWVTCSCGACSARWEDPHKGTVRCRLGGHPEAAKRKMEGNVPNPLRIMGLNNRYLIPALKGPTHEQMVAAGGQWEWWQQLAAAATQAPGYIFDAAKRNTWATIVKVHETSDIKWETDP